VAATLIIGDAHAV